MDKLVHADALFPFSGLTRLFGAYYKTHRVNTLTCPIGKDPTDSHGRLLLLGPFIGTPSCIDFLAGLMVSGKLEYWMSVCFGILLVRLLWQLISVRNAASVSVSLFLLG